MAAETRPRTNLTSGNSRTETSLYQPDSERLQLIIDHFIARLERERRKGAMLDQAISQKETELRDKKDRAKEGGEMHRLFHQIDILEKKLQLMVTNVGEVQSYNRLIRSKIDNFRREHQSYHNVIDQLSGEVKEKSRQADEVSQFHRQTSHLDSAQRQKINILRSKSVNERSLYAQRVQEISEVITKDIESKGNYLKKIEESIQTAAKKPVDHVDVVPVQQKLLAKWKKKVDGKQAELTDYIKKIQMLEAAAKQIRDATGIFGIREIVTVFIKSEEQKYELYNQVNSLTSEIDSVEDSLKRSALLIAGLQGSSSTSETSARKLKSDISSRSQSLQDKMALRAEQLAALKSGLYDALTPVQSFADEVTTAAAGFGIQPRLASSQVTDSNMIVLLGASEECLDRLMAAQEGGSTQFSLEQLSPKRFSTGRLTVLPTQPVELPHTTEEDLDEAKVPLNEQMLRRRARRVLETMSVKSIAN